MKRILVVDDESAVRNVIVQIITRTGHEVDAAADGFDALKKLSLVRYDLVITDVVMPEMDGIRLIAHIREIYPRMKIIAISGGGGTPEQAPGWLENAYQAGAAKTLLKPFKPDTLVAMTNELLEVNSAAAKR
jgi:CheY-like chemotaxis protein